MISRSGLHDHIHEAANAVWRWCSLLKFEGYEPYDLLNSQILSMLGIERTLLAPFIIHFGRRIGGIPLRKFLKVPPSRNPKALALMISGLADLNRAGFLTSGMREDLHFLRSNLVNLRAQSEADFAWGYDWHFRSIRGTVLPRFAPNSIVTTFAGEAFLDLALEFGDEAALEIAHSAANFLFTRLTRPIDTARHLCLSYTPEDRTQIFNSSALAAALQARLNAVSGADHFADDVDRALQFLIDSQQPDGSWFYGTGRMQRWIDHFHTGYNLSALRRYSAYTGRHNFDQALKRGYDFYVAHFFAEDGAPKYLHDQIYPIDIHACTQAILTFCEFWDDHPDAPARALKVAEWMLQNMYSPEGMVFYQRHSLWTDRTPYMRWGQAWAFRALTHLLYKLSSSTVPAGAEKGRHTCAE